MSGVAYLRFEEGAWQTDQYAGAVARLAVRINGAPVPDGFQRLERQIDDLAARLAVDGGHESDAASIPLGGRIIRMAVDQTLPITPILVGIETHAAARSRLVSQASISRAASCPSLTAQTTSDAPRTMSPAAKTPSRVVAFV